MGSGSSELRRFAQDLEKIASKALPEVDSVLKKGAQNIKNDLIDGVKTSKSFSGSKKPSLEAGISYDSMYGIGHAKYEIGPEVGRAGGSLGHIYYEGTSRGGGTGDLEGPLMRETPNLERELNRVVGKWGGSLE